MPCEHVRYDMCVAVLHSYHVCWSRHLDHVMETRSVAQRQAWSSSSSLSASPFATRNEGPYRFKLILYVLFPIQSFMLDPISENLYFTCVVK